MTLQRAFVAALLFLSLTSSSPAAAPPPWSERGVFLFGSMTLDFPLGYAQTAFDKVYRRLAQLGNCSNEDYFCAKSRYFNVVLPKTCRTLRVGDSYSYDGITMTIVAEVPSPMANRGVHVFGPPTQMLLAADGFPNVIFAYGGQGGVQIIHFSFKPDLLERARAGQPLIDKEHVELAGLLMTFDSFGACKPAS